MNNSTLAAEKLWREFQFDEISDDETYQSFMRLREQKLTIERVYKETRKPNFKKITTKANDEATAFIQMNFGE